MKKIKRLSSSVCVLTMTLSVASSAAANTEFKTTYENSDIESQKVVVTENDYESNLGPDKEEETFEINENDFKNNIENEEAPDQENEIIHEVQENDLKDSEQDEIIEKYASLSDTKGMFADFDDVNDVNISGSGTIVDTEYYDGTNSLKYDKGANVTITKDETVDALGYDYLELYVLDTKSNNLEITITDEHGNESKVWSDDDKKSVANQWTSIKVPLSKFKNVDLENIKSISIYEWNDGVYYIDNISFGVNQVTVVCDKKSGTYSKSFEVNLTASTEAAVIYYTTDGSEPTKDSTEYTSPITIDRSMCLKALAIADNKESEVVSFNYVINSEVNTSATWMQNFESGKESSFTASKENTNAKLSKTASYAGRNGLEYSVEKSGSPEKDSASVIINSENGPIDARGLNYLVLYFKDTQGSNGMKVSVIDEDGNETDFGGNGWYDLKTKKDEWIQYYISLDKLSGIDNIDRSRITGVRIGQWNVGTYYVDNVYFDNHLYKGSPDSGIEKIDVAEDEVKSVILNGDKTEIISNGEVNESYSSQNVELIAADGYDIYYTTNGENPSVNSTKYISPLSINSTTTVKAISVKDGKENDVNTFVYKVIPHEVKGDNKPGTYTDSVVIEFRTNSDKDKIYYTTDGSEPTKENGIEFIKPILLKDIGTTTFKTRAYTTSGQEGNVTELAYIIKDSGKAWEPRFSLSEGTYSDDISVKIYAQNDDEEIYYTLDGSNPTTNSTKYSGPITINSDTVVKAISVANGRKNSNVITKNYEIQRIDTPFLKADGKVLRNNYGLGEEVVLRGTNAGGWTLPENWQCPTNAADLHEQKKALTERFGEKKADELINLYISNWWTEEDFDLCKEEGINMLRLPISYFEMLDENYNLKDTAWELVDWFVEQCAERGIYVLIDMHGAIGSQNGKDHSGDTTKPNVGDFYGNEENIKNTIRLWENIAERFKDNPWVCGYDLLNEPSAVGPTQFEVYDRIYKAIREIDKNHTIYVQAIWEPTHLPDPSFYDWENIVYQYHFYGWDVEKDADGQEKFIQSKQKYVNELAKYDVPLLVGEFTFFSNLESWPRGLDIFEEEGWNYTTWTWKVTGKGSSWGLYTAENNAVDVYKDSENEITQKWGETLKTSNFERNDDIANIMKNYFSKNINLVGVEKVTVDKESIQIKSGETQKLEATVSPNEATYQTMTWSSNNENVAKVTSDGVVEAVSPGMAIITATNIGGKSASCIVIVDNDGEINTLDQLKKLYENNKDKTKGKYTLTTWNKFKAALKNAENVINNQDSTLADINIAYDELKAAIDGLKRSSSSSSSSSSSASTNSSTDIEDTTKDENTTSDNNVVTEQDSNKLEWKQNSNGTWTLISEGKAITGWKQVNDKWYYMNTNGIMETGWKLIDDKWYYMNQSGDMATGWKQDAGKWYYMNQSGDMAIGWKLDGGKWYYMNQSGDMATGWLKDTDDNWYYLYENGSMAVNTIIDGYSIGSNGTWKK